MQTGGELESDDNFGLALATGFSRRNGLWQLGNVWSQSGRKDEAEREWSRALAIARDLARDFPDEPDLLRRLASLESNFATMHLAAGRAEEARGLLEDAIRIGERLVAEHPLTAANRAMPIDSRLNFANALSAAGELDRAVDSAARAADLGRELLAGNPESASALGSLATAESNLGGLLSSREDYERAVASFSSAVEHFGSARALQPGWEIWDRGLRYSRINLAVALAALGRPREVLDTISLLPGLAHPAEAVASLEALAGAVEAAGPDGALVSDLLAEAERLLPRSLETGLSVDGLGDRRSFGRLVDEPAIRAILDGGR